MQGSPRQSWILDCTDYLLIGETWVPEFSYCPWNSGIIER